MKDSTDDDTIFKEEAKKELYKKFGIRGVQKGLYESGFIEALRLAQKKMYKEIALAREDERKRIKAEVKKAINTNFPKRYRISAFKALGISESEI